MLVSISEKSADGIHHHRPADVAGIKIQMLRIWASENGNARSVEPGMTEMSMLSRIYIRLGRRCSMTKGYRLSVSLQQANLQTDSSEITVNQATGKTGYI